MRDSKAQAEDAAFIAGEVRKIRDLASVYGFEFGAHLLSMAEQEFMKHQQQEIVGRRPGSRRISRE